MTQIIQLDENMTYSKLNYYKRSPPDPKASDIVDFINRFKQLEEADITKLAIKHISPTVIEQLSRLTSVMMFVLYAVFNQKTSDMLC